MLTGQVAQTLESLLQGIVSSLVIVSIEGPTYEP